MLVEMATIASAVALGSGIAAVGDGQRFDYEPSEIFKGRKDAILYVWVTISSIFSLAHFSCLLNFGLHYHWGMKDSETALWMWIHTGMGALLTGAHFYIKNELHDPINRVAYLWGKSKRHAAD